MDVLDFALIVQNSYLQVAEHNAEGLGNVSENAEFLHVLYFFAFARLEISKCFLREAVKFSSLYVVFKLLVLRFCLGLIHF